MSKSSNPPPALPPNWKDWEGNFDELVAASGQVLGEVAPQASSPTTSLVRYYQQQQVVGRGETHGRTRRFTARELGQVVGAKWMAEQNIPLAIAKTVLQGEEPQTPAESVVAELMRGAGLDGTNKAPNVAWAGSPKAIGGAAALGQTLSCSNAALAPSALRGSMTRSAIPESMAMMSLELNDSQANYITLPAGGTMRYALEAGTTVELAAHGDIKTQAKALQQLAEQLLAGLPPTDPQS
jgi:hypothetical protein